MAGLYIHIPVCRAPHTYDQRYAVPHEAVDEAALVRALQRELRADARAYAAQEPVRTLYAGGGRPSLLSLRSVHALVATVIDVFDTSHIEEATAEVHPADASAAYLRGLRRMGFDRVVLPVLSVFPGDLQALGAPHTAAEAVRALRRARAAGLDAVSVELLFGWPEQSAADWRAVLEWIAALDIAHLSLSEVATPDGPAVPEAVLADRLEYAMTFLADEGYEQYELTHFARPGYASRHQTHYYNHGNQLGLGPSAESFWWPHRTETRVGQRWANVADVEAYVSMIQEGAAAVAFRETLDATALAREYILLRLRTAEGVDLDRLAGAYGIDLRALHGDLLDRLEAEGLLRATDGAVRLTPRGRLLTEAIARRLMPPA